MTVRLSCRGHGGVGRGTTRLSQPEDSRSAVFIPTIAIEAALGVSDCPCHRDGTFAPGGGRRPAGASAQAGVPRGACHRSIAPHCDIRDSHPDHRGMELFDDDDCHHCARAIPPHTLAQFLDTPVLTLPDSVAGLMLSVSLAQRCGRVLSVSWSLLVGGCFRSVGQFHPAGCSARLPTASVLNSAWTEFVRC